MLLLLLLGCAIFVIMGTNMKELILKIFAELEALGIEGAIQQLKNEGCWWHNRAGFICTSCPVAQYLHKKGCPDWVAVGTDGIFGWQHDFEGIVHSTFIADLIQTITVRYDHDRF
jgi:hypothetical protein